MLNAGLFESSIIQSKIDPCLFYKDDIVCAIYLGDTIFWFLDKSNIDKIISELKNLNFGLTDEGNVDSFLEVKIDTADNGTIIMSQPALANTIIHSLRLENDSTQHQTHAVPPSLHKHEDKEKFNAGGIYF